jgi:hypothetical protein
MSNRYVLAVAARKGGGITKLTIGPSEESSDAITNLGVAAHVSAAAPGGRRYIASMTQEERAGSSNSSPPP